MFFSESFAGIVSRRQYKINAFPRRRGSCLTNRSVRCLNSCARSAPPGAALQECGDHEAQKAVLAWEQRNPHENEPGNYLESRGKRLGSFYTFSEISLEDCASSIRDDMDKFHERVIKLRNVVLPEPPAAQAQTQR